MAGIFIHKSMNVGIPIGGLKFTIDEGGNITGNLDLHVHFDVTPKWTEIMIKHLVKAKIDKEKKLVAWSGNDEEAKRQSLEDELESSIQAIMAAGIALDAFYGVIVERTPISDSLRTHWREAKTPRPVQISEVIRQAWRLPNDNFKEIRQGLKEIFRFRDLAVHPGAKLDAAVLLPEINVGVDKQFAIFRFDNALEICKGSLNLIWELINSNRSRLEKINGCRQTLLVLMKPNVIQWTRAFGELNANSKHKVTLT